MQSFVQYTPTKVVFGKDTQKEAGKLVSELGITKVFLVYGGGSVIRSGLLDEIKKSLDEITKSQIEDLTLLDDYDTPKLKDYYSLFDEIIFFPTFKKTKIIECRPITYSKLKNS